MTKKISPTFTLLALAVSAFAIGSTEFISVGLIPLLIQSFHVSMAQAGMTVSVYALGIMVGAPLMTLLTGQINRHTLMVIIMLLFILGNLVAAFAPAFIVLLAGRVIAALAHGIFMTVASVIAADVVAPSKRASAIAVMFTGLTVATVTGVPMGTMIGQLGGWRWSFIFISVIGVIGLIADYILVPRNLPLPSKATAKGILRVLGNPQLLLALLVTALGYGGTFVAYTYLSPLLEQKMGWSAGAVVIILVVYGLMVAIGNTLGGRWANAKPLAALLKMFTGLFVTLLVLTFTSGSHWLGLLTVLFMGFFAFMNVPGLQLYIVQLAEKNTPNDITMASALNIAAFNVGIALGSGIGGQVTSQFGLSWTPVFGAGMVAISIGLTLGLIKLSRPAKRLVKKFNRI
ncbi:MFS transporter [Levilactobacillus yonginensis]|uniref:MFS transporter n=1 Tax=Levilactobacillus yonginensis TaxID=1054041 RepID=UPI000F7B896C|nr:MFS transporter [Levilactobacillus yonginensis]